MEYEGDNQKIEHALEFLEDLVDKHEITSKEAESWILIEEGKEANTREWSKVGLHLAEYWMKDVPPGTIQCCDDH